MKKTLFIAGLMFCLALIIFSCDKETLPPITGVSFQMDSVFFWGNDPELIIRSRSKGLEVTLSVSVDGKTAFCDAEPYAIGEDGIDTLRIDEPLGVGSHRIHAVALGCCGRYVSEDFEFRILPSLEAKNSNVFYPDAVTPLLLEMKPDGYNRKTIVTEADDEVMSTSTTFTSTGFSVRPTFRSLGTSSLKLDCLGHMYVVPLEFGERWATVKAWEDIDAGTIELN